MTPWMNDAVGVSDELAERDCVPRGEESAGRPRHSLLVRLQETANLAS